MAKSVRERVKKRRDTLRRSGLRPIQIWVPDTRRKGFAAECHRQSKLAAESDIVDLELLNLMDNLLDDMYEESE